MLSITLTYCRAYPRHVKVICDKKDRKYSAIPLADAIGDGVVLSALSTKLLVMIDMYTPSTKEQGDPVYTTLPAKNHSPSVVLLVC